MLATVPKEQENKPSEEVSLLWDKSLQDSNVWKRILIT